MKPEEKMVESRIRLEESLQLRRMLLIVDDQEINRDLLGMILESEFDLIYAVNGKEALEQVSLHKERLSAVLLDLVMPVMNGFEVLDAMKADEDLARIPIIVLTAEKNAELEALERGAASFITKPFDVHEIILARVRNFVELAESRRLIHAAERDAVSGLYTEQFFFSYADQIERFHPDWGMEEMVIRIRRYRLIGELYGTEFQSTAVQFLAERIRKRARDYNGIAARVAPDTFYMFMRRHDNHVMHIEETQNALNTLKENLDIRLSIGLCDIEGDKMDLRRRFDCAEAACAMQRSNQSESFVTYDSAMHEREVYMEKLVNDLPRAISEHELKLYYQPKYDITGDKPRLRAAEALVRWMHPEYGMIPPGDFIPLFESNGLIRRVDMFVWEEAARQLSEWKERFGTDLKVSVNVSCMDIHMPGLVRNFQNLIERYHLNRDDLHLEITESAYMENADLLMNVVSNLRKLGFRIEMDDFGSGYSSLNMLSKLQIDVLKADMMFVRGLQKENSREFKFLEIVHDIARLLEVPMISEGVETEEQVKLLKKIGCEMIQGYYFSRPVPPDEFEKFFSET